MSSKPFYFLLPFLLFLLPFASSQDYTSFHFDEYDPITNVSDPEVKNLCLYAVSQYNQKGESHLYCIEVINGTRYNTYLPTGYATKWWFWMRAKDCSHGGQAEIYDAEVNERYTLVYKTTPQRVPNIDYSLGYVRLLST